jgi:5-formyltetrahydrofolate cyclo-ligase
MEEVKEAKNEIRRETAEKLNILTEEERGAKAAQIENRLFEFANFLESRIALLYVNSPHEVDSEAILKRCFEYGKIMVLPAYTADKYEMQLMKVDNLKKGLKKGPRGILQPDPNHCQKVPVDCIDIAIIPGIALDEKGSRIGSGKGYYDRLIPELPTTTRKVALAYEIQIVPQIPMEAHDKYVDIIITEDRVIYKI